MTTNDSVPAPTKGLVSDPSDTVSEKDWPYKIPLYRKQNIVAYTLVDKEDLCLDQYRWHLDDKGYAKRTKLVNGVTKTIRLHRVVMNETNPKTHIDHENLDKLDNRKQNLRACTPLDNKRNTTKQSNNTTGYKGVTYSNSKSNPYRAQLAIHRKKISLGNHPTPEEAALAYNEGAKKYFGEYAFLNVV